MTFGQFLSILRARWWVGAAGASLLTVATTRGGQPAAAQAVHRHRQRGDRRQARPGLGHGLSAAWPSPASWPRRSTSSSSDRVALRVVRNLKLTTTRRCASSGWTRPSGEGSIEQWLVDAVPEAAGREALAREQRHQRQLQGARPALCRRPGQRLRRRPTSTPRWNCGSTRPSSSPPSSTRRAKEAREALEKAQAKLSAPSRSDKGIIATDERLDVETARLNELSSQLVHAAGHLGRIGQPPGAGPGRAGRPHAGSAEQPADRPAQGRPQPRRGAPAGAERAPGRQPPAGAWRPRPTSPSCAAGSTPKPAASPAAWASATPSTSQREAEIRARAGSAARQGAAA